uniref:GAG-pre-integrase domain-containing protein n=1 Tax=Tanacetum cinerariifolium TaxID=118510 RepID=A0A6L2LTK5_TANCI|nr:hypothetical protein [Tanacetum cinerariifolium]
MAHHVQNINHSAFRSMLKREKLFGNNFNDLFHQLNLVLRVENKMFVIEQPIPPAPAADSKANKLSSLFEKQAGVERFDLIQTFHACKQEEGKSVDVYVLEMKGYVDQLERLGYVLPQDIIVGLILNGLTKYFTAFVKNYNMHNMGKTIGELHAMLIEYEKGLPKKAKTPQVMMIKGGNGVRAQVEAIRSFDLVLPNGLVICLDNCHYAPSITRDVILVHRLVENGFVQSFTDYGILVSKNNVFYFNDIPSNGIYEIDMHDLVPHVNSIYNVSTKRAKHNFDSTYLWNCRLAHISKKRIENLQKEGFLRSTDDESFDQCVSCLSGKITRKSFPHRPKRATDLFGIIHYVVCGTLRHVSRQGASYFITFCDDYSHYGCIYLLKHKHESTTRILNMVPTKKVDKTPYELWCIFIEYLKETMGYYFYFPPENKIVVVSKIPMEVEGFEPPQEEVILIRRSRRAHRAPDRLCLNVEMEKHNLGDLNEPASYKAALLDSESNKWIDALNAEI